MARRLSCDECGSIFEAKPYRIKAGTARFCSRDCQNNALRIPVHVRFWRHVDLSGGISACWPWLAARDKDGYGATSSHRRSVKAHRVALELKIGRPLTSEEMACHDCPGGVDHPWCCNLTHLWVGDAVLNARDRDEKALARHQLAPAK
jgi:hypothetical protein